MAKVNRSELCRGDICMYIHVDGSDHIVNTCYVYTLHFINSFGCWCILNHYLPTYLRMYMCIHITSCTCD